MYLTNVWFNFDDGSTIGSLCFPFSLFGCWLNLINVVQCLIARPNNLEAMHAYTSLVFHLIRQLTFSSFTARFVKQRFVRASVRNLFRLIVDRCECHFQVEKPNQFIVYQVKLHHEAITEIEKNPCGCH